MKKDYPNILADLNDTMAQLTRGIPDVLEGYLAMSSAAKADGCRQPLKPMVVLIKKPKN